MNRYGCAVLVNISSSAPWNALCCLTFLHHPFWPYLLWVTKELTRKQGRENALHNLAIVLTTQFWLFKEFIVVNDSKWICLHSGVLLIWDVSSIFRASNINGRAHKISQYIAWHSRGIGKTVYVHGIPHLGLLFRDSERGSKNASFWKVRLYSDIHL